MVQRVPVMTWHCNKLGCLVLNTYYNYNEIVHSRLRELNCSFLQFICYDWGFTSLVMTNYEIWVNLCCKIFFYNSNCIQYMYIVFFPNITLQLKWPVTLRGRLWRRFLPWTPLTDSERSEVTTLTEPSEWVSIIVMPGCRCYTTAWRWHPVDVIVAKQRVVGSAGRSMWAVDSNTPRRTDCRLVQLTGWRCWRNVCRWTWSGWRSCRLVLRSSYGVDVTVADKQTFISNHYSTFSSCVGLRQVRDTLTEHLSGLWRIWLV